MRTLPALGLGRSLRRAILLTALAAALSHDATAQSAFPERPLRFVVPFSPGGNADTVARLAAQGASGSLGYQVIVDNRPGANGNIGMEIVARAAPDGHTFVLGYTSNVAISPSLMAKLPYDVARDYVPVTLLASAQNIVVLHPSVPAPDLRELVALSKAKPNAISFGSAGVGTVGHLTGEMLNTALGAAFQHIPYKGGGQTVMDLVSGQIQMAIGGMSAYLPHIKAGRLRAMAVTGTRRSAAAPDIPTVAESALPGFSATAWYGVLAPAGTPRSRILRLQQDFSSALKSPDAARVLTARGFDVVASSPDEFGRFIQTETVKWAKVVKAAQAKPR